MGLKMGAHLTMQEEREKEVIKVEPVKEEPLFYENGDILLGKCRNTPAWPCMIQAFLGYDEDEVQVYRVTFLSTNCQANLETYYLTPITKTRLDRMKKNRYFRGRREEQQNSLYRSIREAELRIGRYQKAVEKDYYSMARFLKLYCSDADTNQTFIDIEQINKIPPLHVLQARRRQAKRMAVFPLFATSIAVSSPSETLLSVVVRE